MAITDYLFKAKEQKVPPTISYSIGMSNAAKTNLSEQLKGEIERKEIKVPKDVGEEHPFDFEVTDQMYDDVGLVNAMVDKLTDFIWGSGFFTISVDDRAKEVIDQWVEDVNFKVKGRKWTQAALKNTGFLELGGKEDGVPQGIKVLPSRTMFIKRDKKGKLEMYNQVLGGMKKANQSPAKPFKPYQIAHLSIDDSPHNPYGVGIIHPNMKSIDNLAGLSKSLHKLMERKSNAPILIGMGSEDGEIRPSDSDLDNAAEKTAFMNDQTEWTYDRTMMEMKVMEFPNFGDKFEGAIEFDLFMIEAGFQVPEVLLGKGNIPEGLADTQLDTLERRARSIQDEMEAVIEEQIFKRILRANGLDSKVEFRWGQPSVAQKNETITQITELLKNPLITEKLFIELQLKLAGLMDIPSESIKPDDLEREEEENENQQPRVPGSNAPTGESCNHDLYEGKLHLV